eukprot:403366723
MEERKEEMGVNIVDLLSIPMMFQRTVERTSQARQTLSLLQTILHNQRSQFDVLSSSSQILNSTDLHITTGNQSDQRRVIPVLFRRDLLDEESIPLLSNSQESSITITIEKECYFSGYCKQIITNLKHAGVLGQNIFGLFTLKKLYQIIQNFDKCRSSDDKELTKISNDQFLNLVRHLPKISEIRNELKYNKENIENFEKQDWLLLKFIMESYERYYILKEAPNYKILIRRVLPQYIKIIQIIPQKLYEQMIHLENTVIKDDCLLQNNDNEKLMSKVQLLNEIEQKLLEYSNNSFSNKQFLM